MGGRVMARSSHEGHEAAFQEEEGSGHVMAPTMQRRSVPEMLGALFMNISD